MDCVKCGVVETPNRERAVRKIGELTKQADAQLFSDFLQAEGIQNQADPTHSGTWAVWVHRDEHLTRARSEWALFLEDGSDPRYAKAQATARAADEAKALLERQQQKRMKKLQEASQPAKQGFGFVVICVVLITATVAVWTELGMTESAEERIQWLQISRSTVEFLPEVSGGQVWRLLTPIFLHFGFLHLVFNLMAFTFLGQMMERLGGPTLLSLFVLLSGLVSNFSQYLVTGGQFGGLSGVDYALFGFVWMKSRFDPFSGYFLAESTVVFAMVWLVLCFTGAMGPVANMAHLSGLMFGILWGYLSATVRR